MRHIQHLHPIRNLPQLPHQQIRIRLNHRSHPPDSRSRKPRSQQPPHPRVLHIAPENNIPILVSRIMDRVRERVFAVLHAARLQTVNVLPGLRIREGEVIGCYADCRAIFAVQGLDVVGEAAADGGKRSWDSGCAPEEGAWEVVERVEVDVVDCVGYEAADRLGWLEVVLDRLLVE